MKKLTPEAKAVQKEFIREVSAATGLDRAAMAERIGIAAKTMEQNYFGQAKLTDRNRAALERLRGQYRNGSPTLGFVLTSGERSDTLIDPPGESYGARSRLKQAREAAGLTVKQLSKQSGYPVGLLQDLEGGSAPMSDRMAAKLAEVLPDVEAEELTGGSDSPRVIDLTARTGTVGAAPHLELPHGKTARYVPRLSYAQAGALQEWSDDLYSFEGVLAMNLPPKARAFSVQVRGDSMEPKYYAGDELIVLWGVEPRNGQVVVACTKTGDVMCKLFTAHDGGKRVTLTSYNAAHHPPIELQRDELRWVFPVHSFNRQVMEP